MRGILKEGVGETALWAARQQSGVATASARLRRVGLERETGVSRPYQLAKPNLSGGEQRLPGAEQ